MTLTYRKAALDDAATIREIIVDSTNGVSHEDYSEKQLQAALGSVFGLDSDLVKDQTYFVVEDGNEIVACGGWSKRKTLFGSDQTPGRIADPLDPEIESARIRAFFIRPNWARQGIGRALIMLCEDEARHYGFHTMELMATVPGHRLYKACGYIGEERMEYQLPGGIAIHFIPMKKALV